MSDVPPAPASLPGEPAPSVSETPPTPTPTRLSAIWTAVVVAVVVLIALIVFIAQNTQRTRINFLWAHGEGPTSVVMLIAAVAGAIIVLVAGGARIIQLRRMEHRRSGASEASPASSDPAPKPAPWLKH